MSLTGHKTRSVFQRYHVIVEKDLAQAADQLQAYLRRQPIVSSVQPMRAAVNKGSDTIRTQARPIDSSGGSKALKKLEPPGGFEPPTY